MLPWQATHGAAFAVSAAPLHRTDFVAPNGPLPLARSEHRDPSHWLFIDPFCKNARVWKRQALGGLLGLGTSPARMIRWPRRSVATRFGSKHLAALGGAIFKKEAASNRIAFVIGWRRSPILPAQPRKKPRVGEGGQTRKSLPAKHSSRALPFGCGSVTARRESSGPPGGRTIRRHSGLSPDEPVSGDLLRQQNYCGVAGLVPRRPGHRNARRT
jgi:hypothetical protein